MNKATIIGNLTRDPESRATQTGKTVCSFTVAVNRRNEGVDYFRVTAWDKQAEPCAKYLAKGRKVCVVGPVSVDSRERDGKTYANLCIMAQEVEFLSPKEDVPHREAEKPGTVAEAATEVEEKLPF